MSNETSAIFQEIKDFIGFTDEDVASLQAIAPIFAAHGAAITDMFYVKLARDPEQRKLIEGRVDALKRTHNRWMSGAVRRRVRRGATSTTAGGSA
jgi:hypothetical protein